MQNGINRIRKHPKMQQKTDAPTFPIWSHWWAKFAAVAAALAVVAGLIKNGGDLINFVAAFVRPPPMPKGLMVSSVDAESYDALLCLLGNAPGDDLYLHLDEGILPLGKDECETKLQATIIEGRATNEERLQRASFIIVRNEGNTEIKQISFRKLNGEIVEYDNVPARKSFATCLKFEGKAGYEGFGSDLAKITVVERGKTQAASLAADEFRKSKTKLPSASACSGVYMGYPRLNTELVH